MNCQTKLRINHLTAVKSVAILESNANLNFYTWKKKHSVVLDPRSPPRVIGHLPRLDLQLKKGKPRSLLPNREQSFLSQGSDCCDVELGVLTQLRERMLGKVRKN
ncbi:hypothetical protein TNCV_4998101 [Trichonephila clavipes]|nr:hypothetical protein TNCV_4998101 [Trichonephila clavipes]